MKKIIKILFVVLLCVTMMACEKKESIHTEANTYPMKIVDQLGREVILEKEPTRIISGYYISTSTLLALDETENLVGIENDAAKRPIYSYVNKALLSLPSMGTVKTFDIEKCITLSPDLVVLPFTLSSIAKSLEDLQIPVIYVMPESQELLEEMIVLLGKVTNNTNEAEEMVIFIKKTLQEIKQKVAVEAKPRVYFGGNASLLTTAGSNMFQHSLIEHAQGENVASKLEDTYWAEVSYEQILTWDPEYIILAADATYTIEDVLKNVYLQSCSAIKNKRVYQLPKDMESCDSPLPSSVLGVSYLASILHEDVYTKSLYLNTKEQFYTLFYDIK